MKKLLYTIPLLPLFLTSCDAHIGSRHYDVPWYDIAIIIAVISTVGYLIIIKGTYKCPECEEEFSPKWYELSACLHEGKKRLVKCPKCGKRGFCRRIK